MGPVYEVSITTTPKRDSKGGRMRSLILASNRLARSA
jgi:hypothetical protein